MTIRPTQASTFDQIRRGLLANFARLARAQEQVSSGKRILRPSDDPVGAAIALSLRRHIAGADRYLGAIQSGRTMLDSAAGALQDAGGLIAEARALLLQGMNGPQTAEDKKLLAGEIERIRERLLELGNQKLGERSLFAGTESGIAPFVEQMLGGLKVVRYAGDERSQELIVGLDARVATTLPGSQVFAREQRTGTTFAGLSGVASGTSADQGVGYDHLELRHDATSGALGSGLALANGGASDTILGQHTLAVDAVLGTVQLDGGPVQRLPLPGDPDLADFVATSDDGSEVHLDFTLFTGVSTNATLDGAGSVSIDGATWVPMTFAETDLELVDAATGSVLHLDTRGVRRAGIELVTFGGTVNAFDTLQGIVDDLNNVHGLAAEDALARLETWLGELDRNHENVLIATGTLGSQSQRLTGLEAGLQDSSVQLYGQLSNVEDADFSQVVLDMTRAEQTLQLAQATSMRLLQNSLLNFLR